MWESKAREVAFMLDEDGVTTEDLERTMQDMAERVERDGGPEVLVDNLLTLEEAKQELDRWEGGSSDTIPQRPVPFAKVLAIDENRPGVARQQVIEVLSQNAMVVIFQDLEAADFAKVCDIADAGTQTGVAAIFYKPSTQKWVSREEHGRQLDMMFDAFFRGDK